jgi:hypothetical protein
LWHFTTCNSPGRPSTNSFYSKESYRQRTVAFSGWHCGNYQITNKWRCHYDWLGTKLHALMTCLLKETFPTIYQILGRLWRKLFLQKTKLCIDKA